ncbi:MAG: TetR/AcrR family transcriptional regulator, partial [Pseudomonadota bacterium]
TITASILGVFRLFIDPDLFDPRLDFAMRGWALGDGSVRRALDTADDARLAALAAMFARHGYPAEEAETRARVLYWMQVGYYSLDLREPLESRLARVPSYLLALTGQAGTAEEITAFTEAARAIRRR